MWTVEFVLRNILLRRPLNFRRHVLVHDHKQGHVHISPELKQINFWIFNWLQSKCVATSEYQIKVYWLCNKWISRKCSITGLKVILYVDKSSFVILFEAKTCPCLYSFWNLTKSKGLANLNICNCTTHTWYLYHEHLYAMSIAKIYIFDVVWLITGKTCPCLRSNVN